jgi:hypothetical protein
MSVARRPIKCGASLPGGGMCDRDVTVTNMRYIYDRLPVTDGKDDLVLNEIHYTAQCPDCGERTLVEKQ